MLQPDFQAILAHLDFLFAGAKSGKIEIAYTDPTAKAVNKASFFDAPHQIEQAAQFAYDANKREGVNVYVGAALRHPDTAPFGRSNLNDFYLATAAWCDLDTPGAAAAAKDKYKDMPPSFVVVTGRRPDLRAQLWWKLTDAETDHAKLKATLDNIRASLNGDPAVVDPIRVMRLGGTVAWPKKEGRTAEKTEIKTPKGAPVALDVLTSHYPAPEPVLTPKLNLGAGVVGHASPLNLNRTTIEDARKHLSYINPDCSYEQWIAVGMAIHQEGLGFHLWDEWSQRGAKYDPAVMRSHWKSFKPGHGVTYGSVIHLAKQGGYRREYRPEIHMPQPVTQAQESIDPETGEILPAAPTGGLYYIKAKDIKPSIDANDFVQGTLEDSALSVVYGESNCGKTFFATDLCFHVAQGIKWRDRRVEQGGVIYAALEGKSGITNRVAAYKQENMMLDTDMPFAVMPCQLDFFNEQNNIPEFIDLLKRAADDMGSVRLVVIDTLARALMGGDENSGQDMGLLVAYADKIRHTTGAHLMFIHHSGKDKAKGARGHSSLRAAVDTEIEISREEGDNYSLIKFAKQREMEMAEDMAFSLKVIEIGKNKYGEARTSCVVVPHEVEAKGASVSLTPMQAFVFDSIVAATLDCGVDKMIDGNRLKCITYDELRDYLDARGLRNFADGDKAKSATQAARVSLKRKGKINFNKNYIWLLNS